MKVKVESKSAEQTMLIAENFAKNINFPCVISLVGDLGAGKTTFTKGLAKGLGVKNEITSPTFTILNEHKGEKFDLLHFDMYRLNNKEEALELGFEEYFDLKMLKNVVVVEWANNVEGLLPIRHTEIELEKVNDNCRNIYFDFKGGL